MLQILSVGLDTDNDVAFTRQNLGTSASNALLQAVHDAIRPQGWIG